MRALKTLLAEAERRGVVVVQPGTLARYGLSTRQWLAMLDDAGWVCPICERFPGSGRFVTDHEHVRGWKGMTDDRRRLYVRGVTCWSCNRYLLARSVTVVTSLNIADYLQRYAKRRPA